MLRCLLSVLAGLCLMVGSAVAQSDYPNRPVRIIVPSSPGGGTDILARVIADYLSRSMRGQFFVENRAGAGQMIGIEQVAHAEPDGYTLLVAASTLSLNPVMFKNVKYDPIKDFSPITQLAAVPNVLLVHPSLGVKTLQQLIALAKQKPGDLTYGSAGVATSPHMGVELLKSMAGINLTHIPFKGTSPAVTEALSGRVPIVLSNTLTAKPLIESGQLIALGVTGTRRAEGMAEIPTIAEAGVPGYDAMQWYGLLAPAGTPEPIVNRIQVEVAAALKTDEVTKRLATDGAEPVGNTPAEFGALIKNELVKWGEVAKAAGITPQ
jgi:tripartite-type tricarboxylate transporter receptor subunit TctC